MQRRPPRRRAFSGLVGRGAPDDVGIVKTEVIEPSPDVAAKLVLDLKPQEPAPPKPRQKSKETKKQTTRQEHGLSVRDVAGLLKNDAIATYGTNQTVPQLDPRTEAAIQKHDGVHCSCARKNLNCAKQRQKLFNRAKNRLVPTFVHWFTSSEIENYLAYARGEKGLGELKSYFEDIERRAIRCALTLGRLKPLKVVRKIPVEAEEDFNEQANIDAIVKTSGTEDDLIGGQIVTEGENLKKRRVFGIQKPLKTFDKSIIKGSRKEAEHDQKVDTLIESLEAQVSRGQTTPPATRSSQFTQAEKALDSLFGGSKEAVSAGSEELFPQCSQKTKDLQERSNTNGGSFER
jgi:hypothetical protein